MIAMNCPAACKLVVRQSLNSFTHCNLGGVGAFVRSNPGSQRQISPSVYSLRVSCLGFPL